jgi:arylsulfatase A-like enzyme
LTENTLVIFTSDNGSPAKNKGPKKGTIIAETGHNPSGVQSGFKGDAWEGGHHVPFIVQWTGHVPPGTVTDALFCQVDMLATFAALTGQAMPTAGGKDSLNALPLFLGNEASPDGREYLVHRSQTLFHSRKGDWKLIFGSGSGGLEKHAGKSDPDAWQLYDLKQDPGEKTNLYRQYPEVDETLEQILIREQAKE